MPLTKNENPISHASPSVLKAFVLAARPRTWSASLCPVLIGAAVAGTQVSIQWDLLEFTLLFSLLIQIGTNYANDYFDFMKGSDTADRIGPKRAVQQGWVSPKTMLVATACVFGSALCMAIPLMVSAGPWSIAVAFLCAVLGVLYTGGPKPLGYMGLGEVLVFIFFGPVAVVGTYFLQTNTVSFLPLLASISPGLLSAAILIANNLRDEKTDRPAGKNTIVVRFGKQFGSWAYVMCIALSICTAFPISKLAAASLFAAIPLIKKVFRFQHPRELISVLQGTSLLLLVYTLLVCSCLIFVL